MLEKWLRYTCRLAAKCWSCTFMTNCALQYLHPTNIWTRMVMARITDAFSLEKSICVRHGDNITLILFRKHFQSMWVSDTQVRTSYYASSTSVALLHAIKRPNTDNRFSPHLHHGNSSFHWRHTEYITEFQKATALLRNMCTRPLVSLFCHLETLTLWKVLRS